MKSKELRSRPLRELLDLQKRVSVAIKIQQNQMRRARERTAPLAKRLGVSARDLAALVGKKRRTSPIEKLVKAHVTKHKAKFVNSKAPEQTWNCKVCAGNHATY